MLAKRIASKFRIEDGCWIWMAGTTPTGRPKVWLAGKTRLAYRVVYELLVGPIPEDKECHHLCCNPLCVNPAHIEIMTHAENIQAKVDAGRQAMGERHGMAVLTEDLATEIWQSDEGHTAIAARLGLNVSTVKNVRYGSCWGHVTCLLQR